MAESIFVLEKVWIKNGLWIAPNACLLFKHTACQHDLYDGLGDKSEDYNEKSHQERTTVPYI